MTRPVKILYDIQHLNLADAAERNIKDVSGKYRIEINVDYAFMRRDVFEALGNDPNYDFVVIHLGGRTEDILRHAYTEADDIRRVIEKAILVAETTIPGLSVDPRVRDHFDECICPPIAYRNPDGRISLEELLRKYIFIS